jgi:hypothetical protein
MKRLGNYTTNAKLVCLTSLLSFNLIFRTDEIDISRNAFQEEDCRLLPAGL